MLCKGPGCGDEAGRPESKHRPELDYEALKRVERERGGSLEAG